MSSFLWLISGQCLHILWWVDGNPVHWHHHHHFASFNKKTALVCISFVYGSSSFFFHLTKMLYSLKCGWLGINAFHCIYFPVHKLWCIVLMRVQVALKFPIILSCLVKITLGLLDVFKALNGLLMAVLWLCHGKKVVCLFGAHLGHFWCVLLVGIMAYM